jgi:CheY-like chemotaxis protein
MAKEILIADSDKIVQEEFERIFEATDHHLLFTTNDEEALLRGKLFKPDLIIGGKDLCQAVRADRELENISFVILLNLFEDLSEMERKLLRADGMISRPLNEGEILHMVDHLGEGGREEAEEMAISSENSLDWKSFADIGKTGTEKEEEFSLDEFGEAEKEIIELVDVVEEPESRMSIDDFALQQKDELIGEIAPIESWEKQGREEGEEKGMEIEKTSLWMEEKVLEKKVSTEDELFEKIELEEILRKMERLQPSIEKEWPVEKEEKIPEEITPASQEAEDRYTGLEEFDAALRGEVKTEPTEKELQPFFIEETRQGGPKLVIPEEVPVELDLQELTEEEFPEVFLEELAEELEKLEEKELMPEETTVEVEAETIEEEEISELFGEEIQPPEQVLEEAPRVEELPLVEEIAPGEPLGEEIHPPEQTLEEMVPVEAAPVEKLKEVEVSEPEIAEIPKISLEEIPPPVMHLGRKIEETLAKGAQEMLQDFMTQVLPEITRHIVTLTMERIEKTVKEVVPDLAEKAIQEEIQRLQKGEKD